eukprot:TRINITY_DN60849_c0_g1_i1.p2 TRINITY_DN60849_c0_g1~~TRINITY_DN60849_c0_g1_i1.p2  ORF type:complete len:250 (+),score=56.50 TRINITY_DN60849_c0_g1_i1:197-946(+)
MPSSTEIAAATPVPALDLGLDNLTSAKKASPAAKRGRKEEDEGMDVDEAMESDLAKLALLTVANAAAIAGLRAVTQDVLVIPNSCPVAAKLLTATKEYHQEVQRIDKKDRSKFGPPYMRVWQALLAFCAEEAAKSKHKELLPQITQFITQVNGLEQKIRMEFILDAVRQCTASKTYKGDSVKLIVSVSSHPNVHSDQVYIVQCWTAMMRILICDHNAEKKRGQAPRGNIERHIMKAFNLKTGAELHQAK